MLLTLILALVLLGGCRESHSEEERAMEARERFLAAQGCTFQAEVTADYGDKVYTFSMDCQGNDMGDVAFSVTAPDSIAGITGSLSGQGGSLVFDGQALAFSLLADGQVSPASAPWLLLHTLRGGFLTSYSQTEEGLLLSIDDSYEADSLHLDIWLNEAGAPTGAEVVWAGRRILSLQVSNFTFL